MDSPTTTDHSRPASRRKARRYRFGDFELDTTRFELRRNQERVSVEPKVFDVLEYLVRHRARVVPKRELLTQLWPDQFVTEWVLPKCVRAARRALDDDGTAQRMIQTSHGRGYRFIADVEEVGGATETMTPATPFVGREQTMRELLSGLETARDGHASIFLVSGSAGMGKTRAAQELARTARGQGALVVAGNAYEGDGAPPFWPWVQVLRACIEEHGPETLVSELADCAEELVRLLPELQAHMGPQTTAPAYGADEARFRLFDSVARSLRRFGREQPLIIILDDLHWADAPSLRLLEFLARAGDAWSGLVIGNYREDEASLNEALPSVLGSLCRMQHVHRVELPALEPDAAHTYIRAVAGADFDDAMASKLVRMSEGSPFFLSELVRLVASSENRHLTPEQLANVELPEGIKSTIGHSLERLSPACRRTLSLCSVIGAELELSIVEAVSGLERHLLIDLLDEAVAGGVLRTAGIGKFQFSHALIAQALYQELPWSERAEQHRRVGETLEALRPNDPGDWVERIAHHFFESAPCGDVEKIAVYCISAARRASHLLAFEDAVRHHDRALDALALATKPDEGLRCRILVEKGQDQRACGAREAAAETFDRAVQLARSISAPSLFAKAVVGLSHCGRHDSPISSHERLRALLEESLAGLGTGNKPLRATLLSQLVVTRPYLDTMESRLELSGQALTLAEESGDLESIFSAMGARSWALQGPADSRELLSLGTALLERSSQLFERDPLSDRYNVAFLARSIRHSVFLTTGETSAADAEFKALTDLVASLRQPVYRWLLGIAQTGGALCEGRFDEADALIRKGLEFGQSAEDPAARVVYLGQAAWLTMERGFDGKASGGDVNQICDMFLSAPGALGPGHSVITALLLALSGQWKQAREEYDTIDVAGLPQGGGWLFELGMLTELSSLFQDADRARQMYDLLLPFAELNTTHNFMRLHWGCTHGPLGLLARSFGDLAIAQKHSEAALEINLERRSRPAAARNKYALTRVLSERGGRKETRLALQHIDSAIRDAEEIGLNGFLVAAKDLRRTIS